MKKCLVIAFALLSTVVHGEDSLPKEANCFIKEFFAGNVDDAIKLVSDTGVKEDDEKGSAKKFVQKWGGQISGVLEAGGKVKLIEKIVMLETVPEEQRTKYPGVKNARFQSALRKGVGVVCVVEVSMQGQTQKVINYFVFEKIDKEYKLVYLGDN